MDSVDPKLRYEVEAKVGEGAFGEVFRVRDVVTGQVVAMKLARPDLATAGPTNDVTMPKALLREIWALELLQGSPHVVGLRTRFASGSALALILDFVETDLRSVLAAAKVPEQAANAWMSMLLAALEGVHAAGIVHRDVKPANILVSPANGTLLLSDFGQCRPTNENVDYTHQVSTRWYRAPELLFGAKRYSTPVDVWAAAAVYGEMLSSRPLFAGNSDIEQLVLVFNVMGSPHPSRWPSAHKLPDFDKILFPNSDPLPVAAIAPEASAAAVDLLGKVLVLEPAWRATAATARPLFAAAAAAADATVDLGDLARRTLRRG